MKLHLTLVLFIIASAIQAQSPPIPDYSVHVLDQDYKAYYFFSPLKISSSGNSFPINILLDSNGEVMYYKQFTRGPYSGNFRLHSNGLMSYQFDNKHFLMDSTFTVIDSISCKNGLLTDTHDFVILPNGHYLLIGYEYVTMDLSAYNYFNKNNSPGSKEAKVKCDVIQELDAAKQVVFEWHGKDHFKFSDVNPVYFSNPADVDWMHFNAVDDDMAGNILVSSKFLDEITKIRKSDGQIVWRLGGKNNQFSFIDDILMFKGQHDVRITGKNQISLFDNGREGFPLHPETAKEYLIDEKNRTAKLIWNYVNNPEAHSSGYGNVQKISERTMLVNYGRSDQNRILFNVIGPSKQKLFELVSIDSLINYRAFAFEELPWKIKQPSVSSSSRNGATFLEAEKGYKEYLWSDGQSGRTIKVNKPGTYTVYANLKQGGTIASQKYVVKK